MNWQQLVPLLIVVSVVALTRLLDKAIIIRILPWLKFLFPVMRMEPWLFEPISVEALPARQRWFFETHTTAFIARGFTHLGDFVLRRDAEPSCVRLFLNADHSVVGELNCYLGDQVIGCVSVLLDGFYLESASFDCPSPPPAEHGLQFFCLRTDDAGELIEHHAACMAETAAARGTQAAPLEPGDVQAALNYGRQLSLRSLHQQGALTELPEFLRNKTALVTAC
jgi:hypothetical protein